MRRATRLRSSSAAILRAVRRTEFIPFLQQRSLGAETSLVSPRRRRNREQGLCEDRKRVVGLRQRAGVADCCLHMADHHVDEMLDDLPAFGEFRDIPQFRRAFGEMIPSCRRGESSSHLEGGRGVGVRVTPTARGYRPLKNAIRDGVESGQHNRLGRIGCLRPRGGRDLRYWPDYCRRCRTWQESSRRRRSRRR